MAPRCSTRRWPRCELAAAAETPLVSVVPFGVQAVADHGALTAIIGQRLLQERLDAELGPFRLDGDPSLGQLSFVSTGDPGRRVDARMQMVASVAPGPRSLLWGWAHPQTTDPSVAEQIRALGEQHGLTDLTTPEVPFTTDATGDALGAELSRLGHALAATGVEATGGRTPYYLAPLGGGSLMVVLLDGVELRPVDLAIDGAGLTSALMDCASTDHRAALLGFARHHGFLVSSSPDGSQDEVTDGRSTVTASWDPQRRLARLQMQLVGSPPAQA